jgi:hypothetical protein
MDWIPVVCAHGVPSGFSASPGTYFVLDNARSDDTSEAIADQFGR